MTPEQIAALSPEERAEYEALMAEIGDTRAGEGLAPLPSGARPDDVVRLDEPVVVEAGPQSGADLAPDRPVSPPRRALPPLPAPPERGPGSAGISRPRSRMLKVGSALGALFGDGDLPDFYGEERDRADALADSRYRADMARYQAELAGRGQRQKELQGQRPLPEPVRQRLGLPDDAQYSDVQALSQLGWGSLRRQEEGAGQARELEDLRQKGRLTLQEQRRKATLEAIQERARLRGKKGGGSSTGTAGAANPAQKISEETGMSVEDVNKAGDDILHGRETTPEARQLMQSALSTDVSRLVTRLQSGGSRYASRSEGAKKRIEKYYMNSALTQQGLDSWDAFKYENADRLDDWVDELKSVGYTVASDDAKQVVREMRAPISAFLREMTGAAMTPAEIGMHGGPVARLLVDNKDSWTSVSDIGRKIQDWVRTQGADVRDVFSMIDRVRGRVQKQMQSVTRGAPVTALDAIPEKQRNSVLKDRLAEGIQSGQVEVPEGYKILPSTISKNRGDYRIRFQIARPGEDPIWKEWVTE